MSDSHQRLQALNPEQSFIVSAPAGSGKTGLITQRLLKLLCTVENPEEILCITFTRKAAGEMASRVHSALQAAAQQTRPSAAYEAQTWDLAAEALERDKALGWDLLNMPSRLRIQTIDSFCRYIASQFALETNLGELPEPSEQPDSHYLAAARSLLASIEEDSQTAEELQILLAHLGNDLVRTETLLAKMLANRDQWLPHIYSARDNHAYFQQVIEQTLTDRLILLTQALAPISAELLAMADFAACHADVDKNPALCNLAGIQDLPEPSLEAMPAWQGLLSLLVTKDFKPRQQLTIREGFPKDQKAAKARMTELLDWSADNPQLQELIANCLHLPDSEISQEQQRLLNALAHLLPLLAAYLENRFKQQNQCDYSAITLAALQALQVNSDDQSISDITLRLDYQLRHILVDEFQDTSGSQIVLVERLIAGWQPDDGRTLFLVGDAMQSLYGFRNANVGLFLNAQRHPIGPVQCKPLSLNTNFRSQKAVIDWVNQAFAPAFPARADSSRGAIPYSPSKAHKPAQAGPAVSFCGFDSSSDDLYDEAEANEIATLCQRLTEQQPEESIAILVRGRSHLKAIVPALRQAKLNWQAIDIDPLASRMPVVDVLSLTRALISPADRIAWLALLRAPFCGLSLADLLVLSNYLQDEQSTSSRRFKGPQAILAQLEKLAVQGSDNAFSDHGQQCLLRLVPLLLNDWQERNRNSLRNRVETLWMNLGGPATLANSNDLTDVRTFLDLLEGWQIGGTVSDWSGFQQAVSKLYAAASPDNGLDNHSGSVIQIMTIHKAKGLEFDHVILPGLTRRSRSSDKPLLRWHAQVDEQNNSSLIMATLGPHDEDDDSLYRYLKYEDKVKSHLENTRILYVAATRAVSKLYLFSALTMKKDQYQQPSAGSLLAPIWKDIQAGLEAGDYHLQQLESDLQNNISQEPSPTLSYLRRLPIGFIPSPMPAERMTFGTARDGPSAASATPPGDLTIEISDSSGSRHLGTVLHRTLKQIANEGLDQWPESRLQGLPKGWSSQLKQLGAVATAVELNDLLQAVLAMLADIRGQWILTATTQAFCEQALGYLKPDGQVATSVIDRTFMDQGVRWIIDYKYAKPAEGESVEIFSQRQIESYRSQLQHYANLYKKIAPDPVNCALYFPRIPLFIEVDA
ncbi:MAG: UvrD-helicase domain-containing protein [Porticoccaceae bacterium]|nr:UvrD-helicase domain-containing protein [Porticoccaceae bacterium]MBT7375534.1 UvrD-helicase domain-containing protein [Porticoccaceae bacterium]